MPTETTSPSTSPKVSVIIPAYNAVDFLPASLESALRQTFTDFEVLIVDDGSIDGTRAWVATLTDPRVKLLTQANRGASAARNTGIANTTGEYIAFLDADDLWEADKLARQVALLDARPEVGLVHTSVSFIDERAEPISQPVIARGDGDLYREFLTFNEYYMVRCGSTPLVRRVCFDKVEPFDSSLKFAEDWEVWTQIAAHYHIATLPEQLVRYRQHANNATRDYSIMGSHFSTIIERSFRRAPPQLQHLKDRAYGRTNLSVAWRALYSGDALEARKLFKRALAFYPKLCLTKSGIRMSMRLAKASESYKQKATKQNA